MRLSDLEPKWVSVLESPPDAKLGIRFLCPCCKVQRLAIFFDKPICGNDPVDLDFLKEVMLDCDHPNYVQILTLCAGAHDFVSSR